VGSEPTAGQQREQAGGMRISKLGKKIASRSGISQLMHDLGNALAASKATIMLRGGNPAHIRQVQQHFRESMFALLRDRGAFHR